MILLFPSSGVFLALPAEGMQGEPRGAELCTGEPALERGVTPGRGCWGAAEQSAGEDGTVRGGAVLQRRGARVIRVAALLPLPAWR